MWNVNSFLEIAKTCLPDMVTQFNSIFDTQHNRDARRSLLYSVYEAFPRISIDYGFLEKTDRVCMAIGDFRWNDIETWVTRTSTGIIPFTVDVSPTSSVTVKVYS